MSKKSPEYWKNRFFAQETYLLKEGQAYYTHVERQYQQAIQSIQRDVDAWYRRFADNNQISYAEAKRRLGSRELEEFRWSVEEYIRHGQENTLNGRWMKQLENASARVHVTRLESLQLQMQQQVEALFGNQLDGMDRAMGKILTEGYSHTAFELQRGFRIGVDVAGLDPQRLDILLRKPWSPDGENFSEKLWSNRTKLIGSLDTHLTQSLIRGESPDKVIRMLAEDMNRFYNGEYTVDVPYTQRELIEAIRNGELAFHQVGTDIRVLEDINSLVTETQDRNEDFKSNQTIRVLDQIGNDVAVLFNTKYMGQYNNTA